MLSLRDRWKLLCTLPVLPLWSGCAIPIDAIRPQAPGSAAPSAGPTSSDERWALGPSRTVAGGYASPQGALGMPTVPGAGAYIKLRVPTALALRGNDLLVADRGHGAIWRMDLAFNSVAPLAGVTSGANAQVALGPDLSAWIFDAPRGRVLRYSREGRLIQTVQAERLPAAAAGSFALLDAGVTVAVAGGSPGLWTELRSSGAAARDVTPHRGADERAVGQIDAIAAAGAWVFALDRAAARVWRLSREGEVLDELGAGVLKQPVGLVGDAAGRAWVLDAFDQSIKVLRTGAEPTVLGASALRVQQIGGLALDARSLAVSDSLAGQVVIHTLVAGDRP